MEYKYSGFLGNMKIYITEDNTALHYKIGNGIISRRIKIRSQDNGRLYFISKRKYYYLDKFTMI